MAIGRITTDIITDAAITEAKLSAGLTTLNAVTIWHVDDLVFNSNQISTNNSTDLLFLPDTNMVGINTSSPAYHLDVAGDIRSTGSIYTDTITTSGSNSDITLSPNGTGAVVANARLKVNEISADDSSAVSIVSPLQTSTIQASGNITLNGGTVTAGSGSTFGDLTLGDGSITDPSGTIDFSDENLTTTGDITATGGTITGNSLVTGTLTISDGSINDTDGTIGFNDIDLDGIATLTASTVDTNIIQSTNSTKVNIQDSLEVDGSLDVGSNFTISNGTSVNAILDEDTMSSDSATALATQQSIKAYVDSKITTNLWEAVTNNDIDSAVETVDSWDASTYRCAVYHYEISNTGLNEYQSGSLNVLHDGTSAQVTDYAFMTTGNNALVTFSVDIDAGNVRLRASAQAPNSVLNAKRLLVGKAENITWALVENTDVDSATESLDSWSTSSYRSAVYHYQITNSDTSEYQSGSINILHNGSAAQIQEYGVLRTGNNDLITFSVTVSGGNVVLQGSANTPNSQFKAQRMLNGS